MSDFLAGQTLTDGHFPPSGSDAQPGSFFFDSATFGVDADSGTYVTCGVVFTASATGRVLILFDATLDCTGGAFFTSVSPAIRTGSTIGSGTVVQAASDAEAIANYNVDARRYGGHTFVEGLTPGDVYNVRLEHKSSGASGNVLRRRVTVTPLT